MYSYLLRYLLGTLPDEDVELIEEAVVSDDDIAALLCVVETDLIDAYARNRLGGDTLERFERVYLASPRRRAHVRFARRFTASVDRRCGVA